MNALVYEEVGKPTVIKCMEGYNGTVFTYGQTGSGKTYSMRGCEEDPGMMMLCIKDIFEYIENHKERDFKLKVSYMEVYNEEINDLLGDGSPLSKNLKIISEDNAKGASIGNLVEEPVETPEELMAALQVH
jgi:centromeric protein E